jgi:hypothetical protein
VIVKEFKDSEGRPWRLALTCASAARVRDNVTTTDADGKAKAFDIVEAKALGESVEAIRMNPLILGEVLYAVLMPDVHAKGLDKDGFLAGLSGDSLDFGREALEAEIVSFSPGRLRGVVSSMLAKMDELEAAAAAKIQSTIQRATLVEPGMSSGSAPASSESTPGNGPSENSPMPAASA